MMQLLKQGKIPSIICNLMSEIILFPILRVMHLPPQKN